MSQQSLSRVPPSEGPDSQQSMSSEIAKDEHKQRLLAGFLACPRYKTLDDSITWKSQRSQEPITTDMSLHVGDDEFPCHREIVDEYFKRPDKSDDIEFRESLEILLLYAYTADKGFILQHIWGPRLEENVIYPNDPKGLQKIIDGWDKAAVAAGDDAAEYNDRSWARETNLELTAGLLGMEDQDYEEWLKAIAAARTAPRGLQGVED